MQKLFFFSIRLNRYNFGLKRTCKTQVHYNAAVSHLKTASGRCPPLIWKCFEKHGLTDTVEQVPEKYFQSSKQPSFLVNVDPRLAQRIAFSICSRIEEGYVIESDPGFGFMSQVFISVFSHVCLCEKNEDFRLKLSEMKAEHKDVQIFHFNVPTLLRMMMFVGETPLSEVTEFYEHVLKKKKSNNFQRINWIFPLLSKNATRKLCLLNLFDHHLQQLGKMVYYIMMPSTLYEIITATLSYKSSKLNAPTAVLFQIVFDYEVLMTGISRRMFLPWEFLKKEPDGELILFRAVLKSNALKLFHSELLVKSFLKFLQIGLKKKQRVIPVLESYISNCGPLFILDHDLTVYTEFLELSPEKLLSIFQSFSKLPEFNHSTFMDDVVEEYSDEEGDEKNSDNEETKGIISSFENDSLESDEDEDESHSEDTIEFNDTMSKNLKPS